MLQAVGTTEAEIEPRATALLQWNSICPTGHLFLIHEQVSDTETAILSALPSPGIFALLRRHLGTVMTRNDLTLVEIQALRQDDE